MELCDRVNFTMEKSYVFLTLTFLTLLLFIQKGSSLECYACDRQDSNKDKYIKTSIQCEEHHDICWTRIQWGLPPYWIPYGDRMHYVWKGCDTLKNCTAKKEVMMPHCKRDWYDDWGCHECCSGDLCNYYATLGADNFKIPYTTLFLCTFVLTLFNFHSVIRLLNS